VRTFSQDVTLGLHHDEVVLYLDFGRVKLASGNKTAPIWAFTNGTEDQRNIDTCRDGYYTPLWAVRI
jgi:hypothetical protein